MISYSAFCPLILLLVSVKPLTFSSFLCLLLYLIRKIPDLNFSSKLQSYTVHALDSLQESTAFVAVSMTEECQCHVYYLLTSWYVQNGRHDLSVSYLCSSGADRKVSGFFPQLHLRFKVVF